jgi:myo-inositol 2-dehydrogenase / D-chiro-inositol 1-dehydrogenase
LTERGCQCKRWHDVGTELPTLADRDERRLIADSATQPLRLGVIGLGAVAQAVHLPLLAKHPDLFRPVAVCDLSAATRDRVGDRLGLPETRRFARAEDLIAAGDLDAVAIMTSGSHAALALAASRAGLAVFCEKPLAYTRADADELAAEDPRLMLGYMKLYDPAVERARELLAGRPTARSVEVTVLHPPSPPQLAHAGLLPPPTDIEPSSIEQLGAAERELVERALGPVPADFGLLYSEVLLGSVVHDLAVVRYLTGGPLAFDYADAWPAAGDASSVALLGQLSSGTRVSIRWHYLEAYPAYREEVRVHDEQGTIALTFPSPYLLHAPTVLTVVEGDGGAERVSETRSTVEAFEQQWLAFAAFANGGAGPRSGIAEGRLDIVSCQGAAAVLGDRLGITVGGEAAAGRA